MPKLINSKVEFAGKRIILRTNTYELPSGVQFRREVVEHPGAVGIVALKDEDTAVMIRQFRHAVGMEILEIPAGTLEEGEDPRECALRELAEETGYSARRMDLLFSHYLAPGYSTELLHVFLAEDLYHSPLPPDEGEEITIEEVCLAEVPCRIAKGEIQDAKSIAGLMFAMHSLVTG